MENSHKINIGSIALLEAEKAKPSADPAYWSKKSCSKCYGRGIIGKMTIKIETNTIINDYLCFCARKNFVKWRDQWVKEYADKHKDVSTVPTSSVDKQL